MVELKVYIHSFEFPTVGVVDKEGAMHACAQAQTIAFQGLQRFSGLLGDRYLSDGDREVLMLVEGFCKDNGLECDVVDLGALSLLDRLRLRMRGVRSPTVCYQGMKLQGVVCEESLRRLVKG